MTTYMEVLSYGSKGLVVKSYTIILKENTICHADMEYLRQLAFLFMGF